MSFRIVMTEQAANDLRGIFEYIAYELKSVQIAEGQLDRLEKACKAEVGNMKDIVAEIVPTYKRKLEV